PPIVPPATLDVRNKDSMLIALASPRVAPTLDEGLDNVRRLVAEAAKQRAVVVCFPEAYLPGLRGLDFEVPPFSAADQERALSAVAQYAREHEIATIISMENVTPAGKQIGAFVIDADGRRQGVQLKCQLDPSEETNYIPGQTRRMFEVRGLKFGIALCHE